MSEFIQVGVTALRDPATGEYLPAVPLYIKADESATEAHENLCNALGRLVARQMKEYLEGCEEAGVKV